MICVDAAYLLCFQRVALFLVVVSVVFHGGLIICRLQQMYVLFTRGFWLGPAARCSVASPPTLSLPLGSPPWLFLLRGTCLETDSGEVVVNSTLSAGFCHLKGMFSKGEVHVGLRTKSRFQAPALVSFVCGLSS